MALTLIQKLQFIIIRYLISFLWFFDYISIVVQKKRFYGLIYQFAVVSLFVAVLFLPVRYVLRQETYQSNISLLHTGIITYIYGEPSYSGNSPAGSTVLGVSGTLKKGPVLTNKIAFPFITAKAHVVVDNNSQKVLSEHNLRRTFAPASTTKLMTALVAMDIYSENEVLTITPDCTAVDSTKLWLPLDREFIVKDLLYSLLVSSAADASCVLSSSKFSRLVFIDLMNKKAQDLGMNDTFFTNEIGLDGQDGSHYSSAWDLYLLSREAAKIPLIREIYQTKDHTFYDVNGEFEVNISNTNRLLWEIPGTVGVKTGTTTGAGEVLIYQYNEGVKDITIIVLASDDRFLDTRNLLNWLFSSYEWF